MTTANPPRVLVVTSAGSSRGAVVPVLAALDALELEVRAMDVGRAGTRADGTLDKVLRTVFGEMAGRRLLREMNEHPPDVAVAFDAATATALSLARDEAARPAPVLAVVGELQPGKDWAAADADRYLAIDDEAAFELADAGVEGERIVTVGPMGERAFVEAAREDRKSLRSRFRIAGDGPVVLIEVAGFGYDLTQQIALQLSLLSPGTRATFLFDAGDDADAATVLRRQVPTLDLRAKLFGQTPDVPLFWRAADVVVARPTEQAISRALVLGALMVSFAPEGGEAQALARALEARKLGTTATSALLLSSALEPVLGARPRSDGLIGVDGAATIADIAWIVAGERREVIEERRLAAQASTRARVHAAAAAAEAAVRATAAAGGLEDLSGDTEFEATAHVPDPGELSQLRAEVSTRLGQVSKTVFEARTGAEQWDRRADAARQAGNETLLAEAQRAGDRERTRMHEALAEMAGLHAELERLEKAAAAAPPPRQRPAGASRPSSAGPGSQAPPPSGARSASSRPLDDMLADMKQKADRQKATIDDELEALKRKMQNKKKP